MANGYDDGQEVICSKHPEVAVRLMVDAALGYLSEDGRPYTFNVWPDSVGIDGYLNLEEMAVAMINGLARGLTEYQVVSSLFAASDHPVLGKPK